MRIQQLQVEDFRNLESVAFSPHETLNLFIGDNGAGKTSILESLVTLAKGRSFRSTQAQDLIRFGQKRFLVVAETIDTNGKASRIGLEREADSWRARRDGQDVKQIGDLAEGLPLVVMEPNSHLLVSGPPEGRRRFLDWGVFHVEHAYLNIVRRYMRALKQRNAALRSGMTTTLSALDSQLLGVAAHMTESRQAYVASLEKPFSRLAREIGFRDAQVSLSYRQGWSGENLADALEQSMRRDLERGMTGPGPHRADLSLKIEDKSARHHLSRGEQKTLAASLLLAQCFRQSEAGEPPLVLLDDPASEFDAQHLGAVLNLALDIGGQVWLTGTTISRPDSDHKMFHVERGTVSELV